MARLHAVLVHNHDDPWQVARQHIGLVAGKLGVEKHPFAVRYHFRRRRLSVRKPPCELRERALGFALIAPAQNRDLSAALGEGACELLHHGVLPVPPTVRFPTTTTVHPRGKSRRMRASYMRWRSLTIPENTYESAFKKTAYARTQNPSTRSYTTSEVMWTKSSAARRIFLLAFSMKFNSLPV